MSTYSLSSKPREGNAMRWLPTAEDVDERHALNSLEIRCANFIVGPRILETYNNVLHSSIRV